MPNRDLLLGWLDDAYAMEVSVLQLLEDHLRAARNNPDLEQKLREHVALTKLHGQTLEKLLREAGGRPSGAKAGMGTGMGIIQSLAGQVTSGSTISNTLAGIAAERFEIAFYRGLITAADELDAQALAPPLRSILAEEIAMAEWLEKELHDNILTFLRNTA